jgi:hypothetical protein
LQKEEVEEEVDYLEGSDRIKMKRSHSSDNDDKKRGRITSDNSTSTRGTDTHIKKVRKDGTHLKHQLRTGANSAVEVISFTQTVTILYSTPLLFSVNVFFSIELENNSL